MTPFSFIAIFLLAAQSAAATPAAAPDPAFLKQYCMTCHNQRLKTGGLMLDALDVANVGEHAETWEKVVLKLRTGMMPPAGAKRPDRSTIDAFASNLETALDRAAELHPNAGAPRLHRLNRTEYANAIRDLLGVDVDVSALLPTDDSSEGFDNIADVLGVSPSLVQGYISAAMKITRLAVGDMETAANRVTYRAASGLSQKDHIEGLPIGTRGGILVRHTFPLDAEYEFRIAGGVRVPLGGALTGRAPQLDVTINGQAVRVADPRQFRLAVKAGPQTIGVSLVPHDNSPGVDDYFGTFSNGSAGVQSLVITGPFTATGPGDTPSRRRIFVCYPNDASEEMACAKKILSTLARRAFRRPIPESDVAMETLLGFYERGRAEGGFESGIEDAVSRVLVDPGFLFREEKDSPGAKPGVPRRISDVELASRLSFFIWSSIPDDALLDLAAKGKLSDPTVLEQQVRRMLRDPRSRALVDNFAGQWLYLRDLKNSQPDTREFDENLRESFQRETELLFETIIREDRSILDLLDADYTFVDERLARHYGIPNIRGSRVRRITLPPDSPRRGLLGQGSILTVTSVANRTSPVSRGKWVLENILGAPPPAPPPGVEVNLDAKAGETQPHTLRERLEQHRANPVCASCHKIMDPIGFSLENFDLTGKWRDAEAGASIDVSGQLVDGTKLDGPASLRHALLSRSDAFVTTATVKLMTYGLGRAVQYYDMPAVRKAVRNAAKHQYAFSSIVLGIVESMPFTFRSGV